MNGYYELKEAAGGKFKFNLKAGNHEIILSSQLYTTKAAAQNGIESCQKNGTDDAKFERLTSKADQPYFRLKAGNGQIIGSSEMYSSEAARDNGIKSVQTNCATTTIK
ncbi:YegP family protein [Rubritalea spongiae]|uniref:YegP family protein n=1 Tax=Rubritalea spongiae TaxID=430797 RepID=A0ABW5DX77_9BACT